MLDGELIQHLPAAFHGLAVLEDFLFTVSDDGVGVVSAQPRFICTTADWPGGAAADDAITIDGTAYTVRVIQPEGTGVTTLVLEKN